MRLHNDRIAIGSKGVVKRNESAYLLIVICVVCKLNFN